MTHCYVSSDLSYAMTAILRCTGRAGMPPSTLNPELHYEPETRRKCDVQGEAGHASESVLLRARSQHKRLWESTWRHGDIMEKV